MRPMVVVSLLLHALLLTVLLLLPPPPPQTEGAPEASYELVLNGGAPKPTTPGKAATAPPAALPGVASTIPGPEPAPTPPVAPAPAPAPEPAPPPPAPEAAATPPAPAEPAPEAPPAPMPPLLAPTTPPVPQPQAAAPPEVNLPMPALPELVPLPEPPLPLPPIPPPPRPRQLARPVPRPAPRNPSGFPTPQDWSLNGGLLSRPSQEGASGQAMIAGPAMPAPHITGADLGRDWIGAYSAWVQAHLFYPEQAAMNGEDGAVEVVMKIDRTGRVLSVELTTRSGSQWLDLATTGMFRGARVPPFPPGTKDDVAIVDQTIDYILRRR